MRTDVVQRALQASKDPGVFASLLSQVKDASRRLGRKAVLMEVCGSHTWAISHTGMRDLLGECVDLISGPGCPVCVTSAGEVGRMVELARQPGIVTVTYGDMLRVPGPSGSLEMVRAEGGRVEVVYNAIDALRLAKQEASAQVVFLGIGFETTAPSTAVLLKLAKEQRISNFSVYSAHKLMPNALRAILSAQDLRVDGLILPGHVSAVTGRRYFDFLGSDYRVPAAIAGFEACDILYAILRLVCRLLRADVPGAVEATVENCYPRAVTEEGNARAMRILAEVFEVRAGPWRGLGEIPGSVLWVAEDLSEFDAVKKHSLPPLREEPDRPGCGCSKVLTGRMKPGDCAFFGKVCSPSNPVGPCMVSLEGSCRAHWASGRWNR